MQVSGKLQMVCGTCGSADVRADAYAYWDAEKQEWELSTTFDSGAVCEVCEGECKIEELKFEDWQQSITESQEIYSPHLGIRIDIGVRQLGDDEDKWVATANEEDVGDIFKGALIHPLPEEAMDAARRWAIHGNETGSF
jgi:hypothetical protein